MRTEVFERKRVVRFSVATLAAVLGLFSVSYGQVRSDTSVTVDASKLNIVHITHDCSGNITGLIIDPNGDALPGVKIRIADEEKTKRSTISNEAGRYRLPILSRGNYKLQISARGFKTLTIENLKLSSVECLEIKSQLVLRTKSVLVNE